MGCKRSLLFADGIMGFSPELKLPHSVSQQSPRFVKHNSQRTICPELLAFCGDATFARFMPFRLCDSFPETETHVGVKHLHLFCHKIHFGVASVRRDAMKQMVFQVQIVSLDEETSDFMCRSTFDHPYPTTKIMWIPDNVSSRSFLWKISRKCRNVQRTLGTFEHLFFSAKDEKTKQ